MSPGDALKAHSSLMLQRRSQWLSRGATKSALIEPVSSQSSPLCVSLPHLERLLPLGAEFLNLPEITLAGRREALFPPSGKCTLNTLNARHMPCAGDAEMRFVPEGGSPLGRPAASLFQ